MNLLLLTQEEAALAGRPAGETPNTEIQNPKEDEDTEGGGLEAEKVGKGEKERGSCRGCRSNAGSREGTKEAKGVT